MTAFAFPGLNLAVTTPFDPDGRVDLDGLEAHLERYIAAGVDGIVLSSGTGMHVYLSRAESDALVARGAKIIAGRVKVIVQTSALLVEDVVARTRHAADCGADGVMVLPPFFEGPTDDDGILDFYTAAAEGGLPIVGYNVPQAVGVGISPPLLKRLCAIPNFCTVKDSSGDLAAQAEADPHRPPGDERCRSADALRAPRRGERADLGRRQFRPAPLRLPRPRRTGPPLGRRARDLAPARGGDGPDLAGRLRFFRLRRRRDHRLRRRPAAPTAPGAHRRPARSAPCRARGPRTPRGGRVVSAAAVYRTAQLPENPGVCGWAALLPPRAGTPALSGATTADVTVIGAGFAGLSAARRLAQIDPTLTVAVLEAGVVGDGPAGRNSGFIIDLPHEVSASDYGSAALQGSRDRIALQRRAVAFATELAAERGWGRDTVDPAAATPSP